MVPPMLLMAPTAPWVEFWIAPICAEISSVALAVWLARLLTSEATTAKPLPASPARPACGRALDDFVGMVCLVHRRLCFLRRLRSQASVFGVRVRQLFRRRRRRLD